MYDIVFISYKEPNADANWERLKSRFPMAKRVHGVKGIHQAHIAGAKKCFTNMIWIVDGDAEVVDDFDFSFKADREDFVYVWRSRNPINDLEYGYGGVKLFPRLATINMDVTSTDMTTSISQHFKPMLDVSNVTAFNTDGFSTWKSAFRECAKLSSKNIKNQKTEETDQRLDIWCTIGAERPFGKYALDGALSGKLFGWQWGQIPSQMAKINDFDFLKNMYDTLGLEDKWKEM